MKILVTRSAFKGPRSDMELHCRRQYRRSGPHHGSCERCHASL